jgi:hypothetical protein
MERNVSDLFQKVTGSSWNDCSTFIEPSDQTPVTIEDELNVYRLILAQLRSADQDTRKTLSRNLTYLLIRDTGLRKLLSATFDFDESSQHVTTFDQRFQAMAKLIAAPPVMCCTLSHYFQRISIQIHSLMNREANIPDHVHKSIGKICTMTVNAMIARNRKLALQSFIHPVISSLRESGSLTPHNCIEIICSLSLTDFDLTLVLESFPAVFFAYCLVEHVSPMKPDLFLAVSEFLKRVDNSVYMLDDALFNYFTDYATRFEVSSDPSGSFTIVFRDNTSSTSDSPLVTVDKVTVAATRLISACFTDEHQIDFLLVLLERLSFRHLMSPDCAILLCTLIATLIEKTETLFSKFPRKWVRFISETLTRLHHESDSVSIHDNNGDQNEEPESSSDLHLSTFSISVQTLRILVNDREKVSTLFPDNAC